MVRRIEASGPMPFEDFQRAALYDPVFGFFTAGPLRSAASGDFLTSPEVSPLFGEMLAEFVRRERERVQTSGAMVVVEVGAGSGSLLRPLLKVEPASAWAVEVSEAARRALAELEPNVRVVDSLESLPSPLAGVVIANELVDNLPVALAVRRGEGWEERWVGLRDGALSLVPAPARPEIVAWCDRFSGPVPEGGLVEVQLEAGLWLRKTLTILEAGAVIVIDYGDTADGLAPRRTEGTLRTYRAHHLGPDPLDEPGATDITTDVNFTALAAVGSEAGAAVELRRQDEFLTDLGLRDRLSRLRHEELELTRVGDELARLEVRSRRVGAEALLHPRGLGDFRVLVARR